MANEDPKVNSTQAPAVQAPAVQAPAVQAPAVQAPAVQAPALEDRRKNGAVFKDPRIDKAVSWGLGVAVTVALSVGASFMNGLDKHLTTLDAGQQALSKEVAEVKAGLDDKIGAIRVEIAGLKGGQKELDDLKSSVNEVRGWVHELEKRQSERPR